MLSSILKILSRLSWSIRGGWLKIKILSLGGKCEGIPRVGANVYWKYPPHAGISISRGLEIGPGCYFDIPPQGKIIVGENVKFTGGIYIASLTEIIIGDNSLIAEYCSIRDAEHLTECSSPINEQRSVSSKIFIGADVWLCKGVTVLRGAVIKNGAVVGAHSIVKGEVLDELTIYAGVPARFIKKRV
ncbi:acyltransferase [Pseudomonas sp. NFACC39-1]|uniref:acyltransferase n=1 Tax=Pseudomonas sp. NFACC39-1 TaxID=1566195 RepID=UPI0015A6ACB3|nr:acyltransferase [Pseudomonas sp. NFACC39-1]